MIATFRNRNFSLLWLAGLISIMGNWMLIAALPFHIYSVTGSALATSAWLMAYILPGVLFSSVAGVFVDRWDRRKMMVSVSLLQMMVIPLLLLVQSPEWIWIVYIVGFLESTLSTFFGPAESALLPTLVGEEHLVSANSLNSLNDNLARIIGPAMGGVLLATWGLRSVVIADALSYLFAAILIALIAVPPFVKTVKESEIAQSVRVRFTGVWTEWLAGLRLVARDRALSNVFIVLGVALFADAILSALLVVFIQDDAGLNSTQFGWMLTARGVGGLIGGLLVAQIGSKVSNRQLAGWGLFVSGLIMLVMLFQPTVVVLVVGMGLVGIPAIAWIVGAQTQLQQVTTDEYRGRVFGAFGTTVSLLMLVSSVLAGSSADWLGATVLLFIAAGIYIISGLMAFVLMKQPVLEPAQEKIISVPVAQSAEMNA
jgi:predicted MFS family arabinose efflux permease